MEKKSHFFVSVLPDEKLFLNPLDSSLPKDATGDRQMRPHRESELRFSNGCMIIIINITFFIHFQKSWDHQIHQYLRMWGQGLHFKVEKWHIKPMKFYYICRPYPIKWNCLGIIKSIINQLLYLAMVLKFMKVHYVALP